MAQGWHEITWEERNCAKGLELGASNEVGGVLSHQQAPTLTHAYIYSIHIHTSLSLYLYVSLPLLPSTPSRPTKNKHVPTDLTDLPVSEWQRVNTHTRTHTIYYSFLALLIWLKLKTCHAPAVIVYAGKHTHMHVYTVGVPLGAQC